MYVLSSSLVYTKQVYYKTNSISIELLKARITLNKYYYNCTSFMYFDCITIYSFR